MMQGLFFSLLFLLVTSVASADENRAADFRLKTLDNQTVTLTDVLSQGPAVLSFWATWCRPCMAELPQLEEVYAAYKDKGVSVVAISVDDARERAQVGQTARRLGLSRPVALDTQGQILGRYSPSRAVPYLVVVTPDGTIKSSHRGFSPELRAEVEAELDAMLANSGGAVSTTEPAKTKADAPAGPAAGEE